MGFYHGHVTSQEASSKFFREIEHLRRALAKMLDSAKDYMPATGKQKHGEKGMTWGCESFTFENGMEILFPWFLKYHLVT